MKARSCLWFVGMRNWGLEPFLMDGSQQTVLQFINADTQPLELNVRKLEQALHEARTRVRQEPDFRGLWKGLGTETLVELLTLPWGE